jgi:hypothetical protein
MSLHIQHSRAETPFECQLFRYPVTVKGRRWLGVFRLGPVSVLLVTRAGK